MSYAVGGSNLRLNAFVNGLGPKFKLKIELTNTGKQVVFNYIIIFIYNKIS